MGFQCVGGPRVSSHWYTMGSPGLVIEMRPFLIISASSILAYNQTSVSDGGRIVSIDNCSVMFATPYWFARIARCGTRPEALVSGASTLLPGSKTNPRPRLSQGGGTCEGHPALERQAPVAHPRQLFAWLGLPSDFLSMIEMTGPR